MNPLPILRDAWFFFSHNLAAIARLCVPMLVLEAICQMLLSAQLGEQANPAYGILLGIAFYPLYAAPLILFLQARSEGQPVDGRELFSAALRLWPGFALLVGLSTLAIMLGVSLLVLPGIWVMVKVAFAELFLVLRRQPPLQALQSSFTLSNDRFWPLLACMASVLVPLWVLDWWTLPNRDDTLLWIAQQSASGFIQLFALVVLYRLFMLLQPQPGGPSD